MTEGLAGEPSERKSVHLGAPSLGDLVGRVTSLRIALGISSGNDLADRAGLPHMTVSDFLAGKTKDPKLGFLIRIAHALELRSLDELLGPIGTTDYMRAAFPDEVIIG